MRAAMDLESIYFSCLDDNTLLPNSDDFLEKPLCVPQDPIEELEWYPNFTGDLIPLTQLKLELEFGSENKSIFLDTAEKKNRKTTEKSRSVSKTTEDSPGKPARRKPLSENRHRVFTDELIMENKQRQILCPNLNTDNKFELLDVPGKQSATKEEKAGIENCQFVLKTEKPSGKPSGRKPLSETEESSGKSPVRKPFSENQNKLSRSQSFTKTEPVRVLYPNFREFMNVDKFKLLDTPGEKTAIKYLPLKTEKSYGKSPTRKPTSEISEVRSSPPIPTPDTSPEHPPLWKTFTENPNKLFLSETDTRSKQTPVLYHENRSEIESESTHTENSFFVNAPKSVRSKTRRPCRPADLRKIPTEPGKRKCSHCETEKTPQWRNGPLGPKTLCNACGVRYKSGRLLPDYRPAASPTFDAKRHSNYHKRILKKKKGLKNF